MQSDIVEHARRRAARITFLSQATNSSKNIPEDAQWISALAAEIVRLRKELDEARANIKARDYRSFIAGREVALKREDHEFEQWYGEPAALARGET